MSNERKPAKNSKPTPGDENDPLANVSFNGVAPRNDGTQLIVDVLKASAAAALSRGKSKDD